MSDWKVPRKIIRLFYKKVLTCIQAHVIISYKLKRGKRKVKGKPNENRTQTNV